LQEEVQHLKRLFRQEEDELDQVEEHSTYWQTEKMRKLAGYTSDLKHLLPENQQASLSLCLLDEYLQKVVYKLHNNSRHMKQLAVPMAVIK
jgi:hypothetical protein